MKSLAVLLLLAAACLPAYMTPVRIAFSDEPAAKETPPPRTRLKQRAAEKGVNETRGTNSKSIEHAGLSRTYSLHLPPAKEPPAGPLPLVLVLHGAGANGRLTEALTGFSPLADKKGFVVAYPDADPAGGLGMWQFWHSRREASKPGAPEIKAHALARDDIGFLAALIDELVADGAVDRRRVYATGISNGAFMSNRLGCDLSDRIAAIAPVAGTMVKLLADGARPSRAVPVLYMHGTEDKIVGIDGADFLTKGQYSQSAEELVTWWAKQNGCDKKPLVEKLPDTAATDGTTVERRTFAAKPAGAPVIYYQITGGGHTWPGGSFQPEFMLGKTSRDLNASQVIWEFFSQHKLP